MLLYLGSSSKAEVENSTRKFQKVGKNFAYILYSTIENEIHQIYVS